MTPSHGSNVPLGFQAAAALFFAGVLGLSSQTSSAHADIPDIVLYAADAVSVSGSWQKVDDSAAAGGTRLWHPDAGAAKPAVAAPAPRDFVDLTFQAESGRAYRLWLRGKAQGNSYSNDSVFLQFSGSVDGHGAPVYRIGSTDSTTVVLEDCSGCGVSGWGWQDNEYGGLALGPEIHFAATGAQTVRIQGREDGISVDQIVLSSTTYFTTRPGAVRNDSTIITRPVAPGNNSPPVAKASASMNGVWGYEQQFQDMPDPNTYLFSESTDPDGDALGYEWRNAAGTVVSTTEGFAPQLPPGTHTFTLTVRDGHGGESQDTVTVTVRPFEEIVIGTGYKEYVIGPKWEEAEVPGINGPYIVVRDTDTAAPKVTAPLAAPSSYAEFTFPADPTLEYKLWIRLKAQNDRWANDSIWVQFTGSTDAAGKPAWRTGTTAGFWVNLEECSGCGLSGWGWRDDAWGTAGIKSGTLVRFPQGGLQTVRVQTREDGVSIDHIVLSARKYKTTRPGAVKNDATMLTMTAFWGS